MSTTRWRRAPLAAGCCAALAADPRGSRRHRARDGMTAGQRPEHTGVKPTIVLVHGAYADASSWNGVMTTSSRRPGPSNAHTRRRRAPHPR